MAVEGGYGAGSFSRLSGELEKTAIYFGTATGAARAFVSTLQAFTEFDRQLRLTNSVADGTAQTFAALKEAAIQFSLASTTSATEAASSMYYLASAGYSAKESIQAMNGVLLLQQATMADTAKVSDTVVAVLNQYGLQARDATAVADIFAGSISRSQATLEKLAYAFRQVGPVAAYLGQEVKETTSWLSVLFQSGLRGEQAGTSLRNILLRLVQPTQNAALIMRSYGVDVIDPLTLKFKGLESVLEGFQGKGMTAGLIKQLVGDEASAGFKILLKGMEENKAALATAKKELADAMAGGNEETITKAKKNVEELTSTYHKMQEEVDPEKHQALRLARQNMESFDSQLKVAKNDVTTFGLAFGQVVLEGLMPAVRVLGDLGKGFADLSQASQADVSAAVLWSGAALLTINRMSMLHGWIEKIAGLAFPTAVKAIADELNNVATAATRTSTAVGALAPGLRAVPGLTPTAGAASNDWMNMVGGVARTSYLSTFANMTGTSPNVSVFNPTANQSRFVTDAIEQELQQHRYYQLLSTRRTVDLNAGPSSGFVSEAEINRRVTARAEALAQQYATATGINAPAPPGAIAPRTLPIPSAATVATAVLGVGVAVEIGMALKNVLSAYLDRNIVDIPKLNIEGFRQQQEFIDRTLTKQGEHGAALSAEIELQRARKEAQDAANKTHEDLTRGNDSQAIKDGLKAVEEILKQKGFSFSEARELSQKLLATGTLRNLNDTSAATRFGVALSGEFGGMSGPAGPLPAGVTPENENRMQQMLSLEARLKTATDNMIKANKEYESGLISLAEKSRIANVAFDVAMEGVFKASQERAEKLLITTNLYRNAELDLDKLEAGLRQRLRRNAGTPEATYSQEIEVISSQAAATVGTLLKKWTDELKASPAGSQLGSLDIDTLMGRGGRAGAVDVEAEIKKLYRDNPNATPEQLKQVIDNALKIDYDLVIAGKEANAGLKALLEMYRDFLLKGASPEGLKHYTDLIHALDRLREVEENRSSAMVEGTSGKRNYLTETPTTGTLADNAKRIEDTLVKLGANPNAVAGFLANFKGESSFSPTADAGPTGGVNIAQWTGPRRRELQGLGDEKSLETGLQMLEKELTGKYADAFAKINLAPDKATATKLVMELYEGINRDNAVLASRGRSNYDTMLAQRQAYAENPNGLSVGGVTAAGVQADLTNAFQKFIQDQKKIELDNLELRRKIDVEAAEARVKELEAAPGGKYNYAEVEKANAALRDVQAKYANEKLRLETQKLPENINPETAKLLQQLMEQASANNLRLTAAQNALGQRDLAVKTEAARRQDQQAFAQGGVSFYSAQAQLATERGDLGAGSAALLNQERAATTLKFLKEIDEVEKQIVEYRSRKSQSPEVAAYISQLEATKKVLQEVLGLEQKRLNTTEAKAKADHDEANAINEKYKADHQYTGGIAEGFTYAARKQAIDNQDEVFQLGVSAFKSASDKLGTAFSQALQGRFTQAKATLIQWESDLASQVTKVAFNRLLFNPLMDALFGKDTANSGSRQEGSSGGISGGGGSSGGGLLSGASSLLSGEASRGIFGRITDSIFGTSRTAASIVDSGGLDFGGGSDFGILEQRMGGAWSGGRPVAVTAYAKGGIIRRYASGGIFDSPTYFPMADGGTGLMGEAGPEAVMPLRRTSSGRLGIEMAGGGAGGHHINYNPSIAINLGDNNAAGRGRNRIDPRSAQVLTDQIHRTTQEAVLHTIRNEQRPGGMLFNQAEGIRS